MAERRTRDVEHHPLERATDKSIFAQINTKLAEYRAIVWVLGALALALGFKYQTPSARIAAVETHTDRIEDTIRVVKRDVDSLRAGQRKTHEWIEVLARLRCFDTTLTNSEKLLAGLDCSSIDRAKAEIRADSLKRAGF